MIGLGFNIKLDSWSRKLNGFRIFDTGEYEPLEGSIGLSLDLICQTEEAQNWLNEIPSKYKELTDYFPDIQYQMLWLIVNSQNAKDIIESRPIILALLCDAYPLDNQRVLEVLKGGQRSVLKTLGLSNSKAALKFIDKLDLDFKRHNELDYIKRQLEIGSPRFLAFKHYQSVNFESLWLDHCYPFLTGSNLAKSLIQGTRESKRRFSFYIYDTLTLGMRIGIAAPIESIARLNNVDELIVLHDTWSERHIHERFTVRNPIDTHIPYERHLNETKTIKQIKNYDELVFEAKEQTHCVSIYHDRIRNGKYAVFSMQDPERMTIGVSINKDLSFPYRIEQISGYRNAKPEESTRDEIYKWFNQSDTL